MPESRTANVSSTHRLRTGLAAGLALALAAAPGTAQHRPPAAKHAGAAGPTHLPAGSATRTAPDLPRESVDTRYVAPTGRALNVRDGGNLQRAIDQAEPGDVITLESGATFRGHFTLRAKSGKPDRGWITIRTGVPDARLPREGERITPAYAPVLAKIVTPDEDAALRAGPRAHHYRLVGLEITVDTGVGNNGGVVRLGGSGTDQRTLDQVPHHLILDRVYVHGNAGHNTKRCVLLNSAHSAVVDSYLADCHSRWQEAQGILGWNGPGPFKIVNNYVEGSAQNIMFGGSDPTIPNLIPSDIEIRRNHFTKPKSWKGVWAIKNIFELKNAQRVLVEGNVLESVWPHGQNGFAVVIKSVNQSGGCTWCVVRHVTFRNNVMRDAAGGVNMAGVVNGGKYWPGEFLNNVLFENNLLSDIGTANPRHVGRLFQILGALWNISIDHNTGYATKYTIMPDGDPKRNVYIANNVFGRTRYGIKGTRARAGTETLDKYFPGATFAGNVLLDGKPGSFPGRNFFPASARGAMGFKGTDGKPAGADTGALNEATRGVAAR
jgi:hypothetical protein